MSVLMHLMLRINTGKHAFQEKLLKNHNIIEADGVLST